jgi:hypothetical protein
VTDFAIVVIYFVTPVAAYSIALENHIVVAAVTQLKADVVMAVGAATVTVLAITLAVVPVDIAAVDVPIAVAASALGASLNRGMSLVNKLL